MEYKNIFEIEFIQRTQEIVNGYQIPFENTLFINACVGLLAIKEKLLLVTDRQDIIGSGEIF